MDNTIDQKKKDTNMQKVALTALAGTSIEWYDFFLYGAAAALIFPKAFFPEASPAMALILSFGTFAAGFIARPVGGIIFGHFGDRIGRKKTLIIALLLMGISSTLIGLLPTYAMIGIAAPVLLTVLRFAQGIAIGGQWGGAMLLVTESAPADQRGYYGAFAQAGAPVGVILANLALIITSSLVSEEFFLTWGWRIPFIASVILIGISMYIQLNLEDTQSFKDLQALKDEQLKDLIEKLLIGYREIFSDSKKVLDKYSIGLAHNKVIHLLSMYEGISISDLLKRLKVTKQSLNRVLKDLIKLQIIEFSKDKQDTRIKHVFLNDKGKKIFYEIFQTQKKRIYNALLNSKSEEVISFNSVLNKILNG